MVKNWKIPVCTRYRPFVMSILVILVCGLSFFSFVTIGYVIDRRQAGRWHTKVAQIKPGMTKSELIRILGEPQWREKTASAQGLWRRDATPREEEEFTTKRKEIVAYYYDKSFFSRSDAFRYVVYLDENEGKALFEPQLESFDFEPGRYHCILFFPLIGLAVLVWLSIRSWCRKKLRESQSSKPRDEIRK